MTSFKKAIEAYDNVDIETVRENLIDFIRQIAPIAEAHGVFLAIHPDDPPISLLGLPRIVSTAQDIKVLLGKKFFILRLLNNKTLLYRVGEQIPTVHSRISKSF